MTPRCSKTRFATWDEAAMAVTNAKIRRALRGCKKRREQRVYYCQQCLAHHLTSSPERGADVKPTNTLKESA